MYDFFLGTHSEIEDDEESYLLAVKRMLPRWLNSIPDSEFIALHRLLNEHVALDGCVLAETGCGASTLAMIFHAMKHNGMVYSWDIANPKGAAIRAIVTDTIGRHFRRSVWEHWQFIAYDSTSPYLGIPIVREFNHAVNFAFCDSDHTWRTLQAELRLLAEVAAPTAVFTIDDANYTIGQVNMAYINMSRRKLGLPSAPEPADNTCGSFEAETEKLLRATFAGIESLTTTYTEEYKDDIYFAWYNNDRNQLNRVGMEKADELDARFRAWRVYRE